MFVSQRSCGCKYPQTHSESRSRNGWNLFPVRDGNPVFCSPLVLHFLLFDLCPSNSYFMATLGMTPFPSDELWTGYSGESNRSVKVAVRQQYQLFRRFCRVYSVEGNQLCSEKSRWVDESKNTVRWICCVRWLGEFKFCKSYSKLNCWFWSVVLRNLEFHRLHKTRKVQNYKYNQLVQPKNIHCHYCPKTFQQLSTRGIGNCKSVVKEFVFII